MRVTHRSHFGKDNRIVVVESHYFMVKSDIQNVLDVLMYSFPLSIHKSSCPDPEFLFLF